MAYPVPRYGRMPCESPSPLSKIAVWIIPRSITCPSAPDTAASKLTGCETTIDPVIENPASRHGERDDRDR